MSHSLMLENAVLITSVFTGLMVLGLVLKIRRLYSDECYWLFKKSELVASDVFHQLERFASHHLLKVKDLTGDLENFEGLPEQRKLIALYLIGASEYLGKQHSLDILERKVLAFSILEKVMKVSLVEVSDLYEDLKTLKCESNKHSIKLGARALGHWLNKGTSNNSLSLQTLFS